MPRKCTGYSVFIEIDFLVIIVQGNRILHIFAYEMLEMIRFISFFFSLLKVLYQVQCCTH